MRRKVLAGLAGVAGIAGVIPAMADGAATTIDAGGAWNAFVTPLIPSIAAAAGIVITGLATMAMAWLSKKLNLANLEMDAHHRDALQTAVTNAAGLALNSLGNNIQGKTVDVQSPEIANAVRVAMSNAPDAIKYFKLDQKPEKIAEKILAKLPQIANTSGAPQ